MEERRVKLDAKEVMADIQSGMSDADLMRKYRLSEKGVQNLLKKLVELGILKHDDLDRRPLHLEIPAPVSPDIDRKPSEEGQAEEKVSEQEGTGDKTAFFDTASYIELLRKKDQEEKKHKQVAEQGREGDAPEAKPKAVAKEQREEAGGSWSLKVTYLNVILTVIAGLLAIQVLMNLILILR
jgi:DNA-binding Lrp family transcriptional regulator